MKAAIVGGGVIGGGWAARFLLHGWDVAVFDPDPEAERRIAEVLGNARRALPVVLDSRLPAEGRLSFTASIAEAMADAVWIQESVTERLDLKHRVYADIQAHAAADAIIGSSTSGFTPSQLQEKARDPSRIIVAHPYNPVYLLPVVELVPSPVNPQDLVEQARDSLLAIGMKPIVVRKEIDAHIGDRLLEAVWREALWLIKDGVATTEEVDTIITHGFGLRWAQMGLFETYRVAGGEAGMAHFIGQFGPALQWPWTKLMDVPELTDELVAMIAGQSDAHSGHLSIRELERIRDDNLVGFLRVLKERNWGAGAHKNAHDIRLAERESGIRLIPSGEPYRVLEGQVLPSWIDYNGHMTEPRYGQVFSDASDAFLTEIGLDADYVASGRSYYTVENHVIFAADMALGTEFVVETQVLGADEKRLHLFHRILTVEDGRLAATGETMLLHVDMNAGRTSPADQRILARLLPLAEAHGQLDRPTTAGRFVGQPKR